MTIDWGIGSYEPTGEVLQPVSERVIDLAEPLAGRSVLDVGCGTGNAALLAAARGAVVTGVDPAGRLLEVARDRAARQALDVTFVQGDAAAIPVPDQSADVVVSVFGVIFAPDSAAAVAELVRVTAPDGLIMITSWPPDGPLSVINGTAGKFMGEVFGQSAAPAEPKPLAWHDTEALKAAFDPHGFVVQVVPYRLTFTGRSPEEYIERSSIHPMAVSAANALSARPDGAELAAELQSRLLAATRSVNEDPAAFRITNQYAVALAKRG